MFDEEDIELLGNILETLGIITDVITILLSPNAVTLRLGEEKLPRTMYGLVWRDLDGSFLHPGETLLPSYIITYSLTLEKLSDFSISLLQAALWLYQNSEKFFRPFVVAHKEKPSSALRVEFYQHCLAILYFMSQSFLPEESSTSTRNSLASSLLTDKIGQPYATEIILNRKCHDRHTISYYYAHADRVPLEQTATFLYALPCAGGSIAELIQALADKMNIHITDAHKTCFKLWQSYHPHRLLSCDRLQTSITILQEKVESKVTVEQAKLPAIPCIIHMLWCGGHLPEKYVYNIHTLAARAHGTNWQLIIYTDNPKNIVDSFVKADLCDTLKHIKIEPPNIDQLIDNFVSTLDLNDLIKLRSIFVGKALHNWRIVTSLNSKRPQQFCEHLEQFRSYIAAYLKKIAAVEGVGTNKNWAAYADLFRLLALFKKGGIWSDTDLNASSILDTTRHGIKIPELHPQYGILVYSNYEHVEDFARELYTNPGVEKKRENLEYFLYHLNNHSLASLPGHEIIKACLLQLITNYVNLEFKTDRQYWGTPSEECFCPNFFDQKRTLNKRSRWDLTLETSGPHAMTNPIREYFTRLPMGKRDVRWLFFANTKDIGSCEEPCTLGMQIASDNTWLATKGKKPPLSEI
jgi:mannosyltransferase OCH1-like enzyme